MSNNTDTKQFINFERDLRIKKTGAKMTKEKNASFFNGNVVDLNNLGNVSKDKRYIRNQVNSVRSQIMQVAQETQQQEEIKNQTILREQQNADRLAEAKKIAAGAAGAMDGVNKKEVELKKEKKKKEIISKLAPYMPYALMILFLLILTLFTVIAIAAIFEL